MAYIACKSYLIQLTEFGSYELMGPLQKPPIGKLSISTLPFFLFT